MASEMTLSAEPTRVLIVKLNLLGDTVAFLPTVNAIRKAWPDAHLTFLATEIGKEVIHGMGVVDRVWVSEPEELNSLSGLWKWIRIVRRGRFEVAVASSDSSSYVALLFFLSSIPVRTGFTNSKLQFLYKVRVPFSTDVTHVELNLRIAEHLGIRKDCIQDKIDIDFS